MFPRKQISGSQKRKRKKREEEIIQSQRGSLDRYFVKETNESVENHVENLVNEPELHIHCCLNLETALRNGDGSDIDAKYLLMELQILQEMLPNEAYETDRPWTSIQIMEFAKKMDMFPSVMVAYRILLTIPVTVASAERSFSKLKLLKSYLRTTMTQDRLNRLAILTIERNMLVNVDYEKIIDDFASRNARRHHFR
ncbi:putative HAT dimerization domain-containing protein [Rosa chinensis]|uniref:Putative HAT dimerization domain-containing protein n=1 Tax=Rosa chinensis TaxID=74649 RepID=A0A2P6QAX4_ROSCH|nr:putative HAT dimerization domain-containing protein [Rosa chinensis]